MKYFFILWLFVLPLPSAYAGFSVTGGNGTPLEYADSPATARVYLLNTLSGASIEYTANSPSVKFFKYSSPGDEIEIQPSSVSGNMYRLDNIEDGRGYIAQDNDIRYAVWIIDYSRYLPTLRSIEFEEYRGDEECTLKLLIDKEETPMRYYDLSGRSHTVERKYRVIYQNLQWDETESRFVTREEGDAFFSLGTDYPIDPAPLMDTEFTVRGDQFADYFGIAQEITKPYKAIAVEPHVVVKQLTDVGEEIEITTDENGNIPAPATLRFYGIFNEPVTVFHTWYVYHKSDDYTDPNGFEYSYPDRDFTHTFTLSGKYNIVLEVASEGSACLVRRMMYEFTIAESLLDAPNFFTPGDSPGVNDVFKVKHKSLVKFHCTIFNRWGNKVYEFSDPDGGWDGKYNGKLVNPGVYFYVIDALGSDGIRYKKGGDINIVRKK
ncbi:MAG: gliding motility-associated C-terminal domain-containing protein [Prevotella sp.]|jgi:gliding motility-associated-like protein|nr:gliding motility-associated C-terminal domain-containing protein [Prevotella sp.]